MGIDQEFKPQKLRHFIYVAEPDEVGVYAVMTLYWETDPINAVGQIWAFAETADNSVQGETVLNTNDGLSTLWASPEGNLWAGSAWGRIWTTAQVNWDPGQIPDLQRAETDPHFKWKATELPRKANGARLNVADIWGSSDTDVHLATFEGTIFHWDGSQWGFSHTDNKKPIVRLHGTGTRNIWAVGRDGLVLHFDGTRWLPVPIPGDAGQGETLTGVWALSEDEVYICSTSGAVFHGTSHRLERLGEYPYSFYGIVEFRNDLYLAAGDHGVCVLRGNRIEQVKDTFAATGIYKLKGRLAFVEPVQEKTRVIIFEPTSAIPWSAWSG